MIHVFKGIVAGAMAGCAASYIMNEFQELKPRQNPARNPLQSRDEMSSPRHGEAREATQRQEGGDDATVKTAQRISRRVFHHELTDAEKKTAGPAVHYAYGSLVGGLYGGLAELLPGVAAGVGIPYGFALWLFGDEVAVPALGLGKSPLETPPEQHADALAAHFVYGAATDLLRRVFKILL